MDSFISTPADAAFLFRAALPKVQREERVFVLPLDGSGKVLADSRFRRAHGRHGNN